MFIFEPSADGKNVAFLIGTPKFRKVVSYIPANSKKHAKELVVALNNLLIRYGDDTIHLWIQGEDYTEEALTKIAEVHTKNELVLENAIKIDEVPPAPPAVQDAPTRPSRILSRKPARHSRLQCGTETAKDAGAQDQQGTA